MFRWSANHRRLLLCQSDRRFQDLRQLPAYGPEKEIRALQPHDTVRIVVAIHLVDYHPFPRMLCLIHALPTKRNRDRLSHACSRHTAARSGSRSRTTAAIRGVA